MNRQRIEHSTQLSEEEKSVCDASTSEVILYYIVNKPNYIIGLSCTVAACIFFTGYFKYFIIGTGIGFVLGFGGYVLQY